MIDYTRMQPTPPWDVPELHRRRLHVTCGTHVAAIDITWHMDWCTQHTREIPELINLWEYR